MCKCHTIELSLLNISGCLVDSPECEYAHKFGFGIVCRHPEHTEFHVHVTDRMTKDAALEQYNAMRQKRRDEFTASLDENDRASFCHQTDFFGKPLSNPDLNEQK